MFMQVEKHMDVVKGAIDLSYKTCKIVLTALQRDNMVIGFSVYRNELVVHLR